ncbi:MAG: shikimate dehydrogenase [Dehalococcoidia bacterium]|nr:shikimate dehydrogenase [Dehalococcoidia bacterium]
MTQTIALIGHPVAHSLSPAFQQAALDALGVDARYEAWDLLPEELPMAAERLRSAALLGANVTVPHKEAMLRFIDRPDALVERVGALNTIVHREGQLHATNTDVSGVLRALEAAGASPRGMRVVLLGAGGAARAVVVAMRVAEAASVVVANRTRGRAEDLVELGGEAMPVTTCGLEEDDAELEAAMARADLVVNSTTLGMTHGPDEHATPVPARMFRGGQVAFDLVYVPERTPFLEAAEAAGARPVGGLAMLVHQGAESFRLWTGYEPPVDVMFEAARAALAARAR